MSPSAVVVIGRGVGGSRVSGESPANLDYNSHEPLGENGHTSKEGPGAF